MENLNIFDVRVIGTLTLSIGMILMATFFCVIRKNKRKGGADNGEKHT